MEYSETDGLSKLQENVLISLRNLANPVNFSEGVVPIEKMIQISLAHELSIMENTGHISPRARELQEFRDYLLFTNCPELSKLYLELPTLCPELTERYYLEFSTKDTFTLYKKTIIDEVIDETNASELSSIHKMYFYQRIRYMCINSGFNNQKTDTIYSSSDENPILIKSEKIVFHHISYLIDHIVNEKTKNYPIGALMVLLLAHEGSVIQTTKKFSPMADEMQLLRQKAYENSTTESIETRRSRKDICTEYNIKHDHGNLALYAHSITIQLTTVLREEKMVDMQFLRNTCLQIRHQQKDFTEYLSQMFKI